MSSAPTPIGSAGYPALLAELDLNLMESAALMVYAREWMMLAPAGPMFTEFRALYLAARAIFIRRFFEVPPTS